MYKPGQILMLTALAASAVWAQDIISTRSGLIHYINGTVTLDGQPVTIGNSRFPSMAAGQVLEVEEGYAEVLLTPGAFLRLDRGASVRMVANSLEDTRLELLSGTALVEVDELLKGNRISVTVAGIPTSLLKYGLYSFDAETKRVKVFDGKVQTSDGGLPVELGRGRSIQFEPGKKPEKFNAKQSKDDLYAWSQQRAAHMATANVSISRGWNGPRVRNSFWAWDPWMNTYTFMPGGGTAGSVFGPRWYNPQTVWILSQPSVLSGGGYSGGNQASQSPASSGGGTPPVNSGGGGPSAGAGAGSGGAPTVTSTGATMTRTSGGHSQ